MTITLWLAFLAQLVLSQDIKLTPDMYEYSPNSITGVYVCTPAHVQAGDCRDVDPQYFENLAYSTLGSYEIGVLRVNDQTSIAFNGPLSPGAADNLIGILEARPQIKTLTLSSIGGSTQEAIKIADYIATHGYQTWIPNRRACLSACTLIFLSGSEATLEGYLGFHTGQASVLDPYQIRDIEAATQLINDLVYQNNLFQQALTLAFLQKGVPLELTNAIIAARGDFLVFDNMEDLKEGKVLQPISGLEPIAEKIKSQPVSNFNFEGYDRLY